MKNRIGKIKKIPLKNLWETEDKHFTTWLEDNIDYLNEILDFEITIEKREKRTSGTFKVDLFGEDNLGNKVIIENQLGKTDHDHLGKVITYLTSFEANTAIWISGSHTEEHVKAIEWLNEVTPDNISFYLIKLEAIQIESCALPAPVFTIIKGPSKEAKQIGLEKREDAERHILRREFWTQLLEKSRKKTRLHSNISPNRYSWIGTSAGKAGINYNYVITNTYVACEVWLDKGKDYEEPNINKERFDQLYKSKRAIEKEFGGKLSWERLDNKRASRVAIRFKGVGLKDKEKWEMLQTKMINAMIKLEKSFKLYISKVQ